MAESVSLENEDEEPAPPRNRLAVLLRTRPEFVLSPLLFVIVVVGWELSVRFFQIPAFVIPPISQVFIALYRGLDAGFLSREGYWLHSLITLSEVLLGFFIGSAIGLALGVFVSQIRLVEATLRPYIVAFQSLPKVAVAPIIVLWFGYDLTSKVIIVCMLTFFPVLVTSMAGFHSVDLDRIDLLRSLSATRWQIFWKVKFPSAMPYIFAGLDMAAVFAVVGAIVGEFVGAQKGLGVEIMQMNASMDVAGSFSVFIILAIMGLVLNVALRRLQSWVLFWAPSESQQRAVNV
jgi:NitT/TauT family transport system permease protein